MCCSLGVKIDKLCKNQWILVVNILVQVITLKALKCLLGSVLGNLPRRPYLFVQPQSDSNASLLSSPIPVENRRDVMNRDHNMAIRYRFFNRLDPGGLHLVRFFFNWVSREKWRQTNCSFFLKLPKILLWFEIIFYLPFPYTNL